MAVSPVREWAQNENLQREENSAESHNQTKKGRSKKYVFKKDSLP
jgi:hypothetical protein